MACPKCECKTTYQYDQWDDDFSQIEDENLERCAACGAIFEIEDALPEDDDYAEVTSDTATANYPHGSLGEEVEESTGGQQCA